MAIEAPKPALPSWVAFLASGLCFVAAGYLATTASLWSSPLVGSTPLLGLPDALVDAPWVTPLALIVTGLTLLVCARLTPARTTLWRALTYPTAIVVTLAACALCGAHVLTFQHVAQSLRAAPYLEGAPLPLSAPPMLAPPTRAAATPDPRATEPWLPKAQFPRDAAGLIALLADGDAALRRRASDALLELSPESIPVLCDTLASPHFPARPLVVDCLAMALLAQPLADTQGLLTLQACLRDPSGPVRSHAAAALGELNDLRCVKSLVDAFDPTIPEFRAALEALTGVSFKRARAAARWWRQRRWAYGPQLGAVPEDNGVGHRLAEELTAALVPGALIVNEVLVDRLVTLGSDAIPALVQAGSQRGSRGEIGWALARILATQPEDERDPAALRAVIRAQAEPGRSGALAARGLIELKDPRTVKAQIECFAPEHTDRVEALEAVVGERFESRAAARVWWAEHGRGYQGQIELVVELTRVTLGDGQLHEYFPRGGALILEGWFSHDCAGEACEHEEVQVTLRNALVNTPAMVLDASPESIVVLIPTTSSTGPQELELTIRGQFVGSQRVDLISAKMWSEYHDRPGAWGECGCSPH